DSTALYTAAPDGSEFKQLCAGGACGIDASWTPDGAAILFWREGSWWAMDRSSTHQRSINPALDSVSGAAVQAYVIRLAPDAVPPVTPTEPTASPVALTDVARGQIAYARRVFDSS